MAAQITWALRWRADAPESFQVTPEVADTIAHSIEGLDPHDPVFRADRCYPWKLWSCVVVRTTGEAEDTRAQMHLRTPLTPAHSKRSQNLRALLAYHYFGVADRPLTSSRKPCVCGSGRAYGACCFPTVHSHCHLFTGVRSCGSCVNPLHFVRGKNSDPEPGAKFPYCDPVILPCAPCAQCAWTPYRFVLADGVFGEHRNACAATLPLDGAVEAAQLQLERWRHEGVSAVEQTPRVSSFRRRHYGEA